MWQILNHPANGASVGCYFFAKKFIFLGKNVCIYFLSHCNGIQIHNVFTTLDWEKCQSFDGLITLDFILVKFATSTLACLEGGYINNMYWLSWQVDSGLGLKQQLTFFV